MKAVRVVVFIILLLCHHIIQAQNKQGAGFGIETNFHAGRIYKHTENFKPPVPDLTTAVEVNFLWQTYGKKEWQQRQNYPLAGFGITCTNYGIDSIYGKCISIYPTLQLPIIKGKKLEWTARVGCGLGYVTKHYERAPNWDTINNAIGSHVNNYTVFATDIRYHINEHWDVQAGGNFSHVSNAVLRAPNLGINVYGGHIGLRYFPVTSQPERIVSDLPKLPNRWLLQFRAGFAASESSIPNGPLYPIHILSMYGSRRYKGKNKFFVGADYAYYKGVEAFLKNNEIFPGQEKQHSWNSSVYIGNEFVFGIVGIHLQVGYYIKETTLKQDPYYQKLGGNIYLMQHEKGIVKELFTSLMLKTHKTQAELAELGIGIGL